MNNFINHFILIDAECPVPQTPEHALIVPKYNGAILLYFCEPGYTLFGSHEIYCNGKQWNGTVPYCRGIYKYIFFLFIHNKSYWKIFQINFVNLLIKSAIL